MHSSPDSSGLYLSLAAENLEALSPLAVWSTEAHKTSLQSPVQQASTALLWQESSPSAFPSMPHAPECSACVYWVHGRLKQWFLWFCLLGEVLVPTTSEVLPLDGVGNTGFICWVPVNMLMESEAWRLCGTSGLGVNLLQWQQLVW